MILPITSQPNYNVFHNNRSTTVSTVEKTPIYNSAYINDAEFYDFMKTTQKQNEKRNKLLLCGELAVLFGSLIITGALLNRSSSTKSTSSKIWTGMAREFESLKSNANIPTLDSCKSINKKLRSFLQAQVNYSKVKPEDIKKVGTPKPANKLLLYGPPGTGKSYFAKIYAKSLDAEYAEIKYSEINSTWAGQHLEQLTSIFEDILAKSQMAKDKKFVVVFNEIDALVIPAESLRKGGSGNSLFKLEERSVFLNYIDEIAEKAPNVTIIGTTNISPKNNGLDGAAMSRFKNIIGVDYPEKDCLYEALKANLEKMDGGKSFIGGNDKNLEKLAETMAKRKSSFRDLDKVIDTSKNYYLEDYTKNNNAEFKFKYLEDAFKDLDLTDGEISSGK